MRSQPSIDLRVPSASRCYRLDLHFIIPKAGFGISPPTDPVGSCLPQPPWTCRLAILTGTLRTRRRRVSTVAADGARSPQVLQKSFLIASMPDDQREASRQGAPRSVLAAGVLDALLGFVIAGLALAYYPHRHSDAPRETGETARR
jgi:hypothetical protein